MMYPSILRTWLFDLEAGRGGPGRGRIQSAAGIVNKAHQRPDTRTASWRLLVVEPVKMTRGIVVHCISTPEEYPIAIPCVDILVERRRDCLVTDGVISAGGTTSSCGTAV